MGQKMALSFKNNERDLQLYEIIKKQRDKSNFIKDAIEFYVNYINKGKIEENSIYTNTNSNINTNTNTNIEKTNISAALSFMNLDDD